MFVNALTACDKYSVRNRDNLTQPIQMHISQKQETLSQFFLYFRNVHSILNVFQKKETLIADGCS